MSYDDEKAITVSANGQSWPITVRVTTEPGKVFVSSSIFSALRTGELTGEDAYAIGSMLVAGGAEAIARSGVEPPKLPEKVD